MFSPKKRFPIGVLFFYMWNSSRFIFYNFECDTTFA